MNGSCSEYAQRNVVHQVLGFSIDWDRSMLALGRIHDFLHFRGRLGTGDHDLKFTGELCMNIKVLHLTLLAVLLFTGCGAVNRNIVVEDGQVVDGDVSNVNGSISIGRECRITGNVRNVNGRISVGPESQAGAIRNTNGAIALDQGASVERITSTNGAIDLGENVRVAGNVENTNGRIVTASGTRIGGTVESLNGRIQMVGSQAAGLSTSNGGVELLDGTRIDGELHVRRTRGTVASGASRIIIGPDVVVTGPVRIEREVELYIHESATTGEISGADPIRYSGDTP